MNNTVERFLSNTLTAFVPKKTFTPEQVRQKLIHEIHALERWFIDAEPDTKVWHEKNELLKIKRENLNEINEEIKNNGTDKN